jgi:hypothetical protein
MVQAMDLELAQDLELDSALVLVLVQDSAQVRVRDLV